MKAVFSFLSMLVLSVFLSNTAFADIRLFEIHRQKILNKKLSLFETESGNQTFTFKQKLNHADPSDGRTFTQRYFINSDFAGPLETSPVLLYICGESECSTNSSMLLHAKDLGAHVVYVEHRYYGKSLPTYNLTTENLKYLSTDMALEDLKTIQNYLQKEKHFNGKWIAVGGSYAGSLSAYYRLKNPDLVVGALASSGPVMAKENFEEYDRHVSEVVGLECGAKMKEAVKIVEDLLDQPDELLKIKKSFQGEALTDNVDFLYLLADMGAIAAQYGHKDRFCLLVNSADPLKGYADFTKEIFSLYGMTALDMSAAGALETQLTDESGGMRQWFYQSCTEYGYWQNAYHDEKISVRSPLINAKYHRNICRRVFGLDTAGNEKSINEKYYFPLFDSSLASNILFTNGSQDPWINLSIAPENVNDINSKTPSLTMRGASHCSDLGGSSLASVKTGRALFIELSRSWLAN